MPARLKVIVAYNGTPFSGWQSQADRNAVQDHLETAFAQICGERVRVHGAGRTDAGVHALAQCAHVDLSVRRYDAGRWMSALNGVLPPAIRIMRAGFASPSFHARFSAKGKLYRYRIWNQEVLPPLESGRAWHVRDHLECKAMQTAADRLLGRHDFRSFAANRGSIVKDAHRTVLKTRVRRLGALVTIEVEADGFLYKMVRMIVGALVRVGLGISSPGEIEDRLGDSERSISGPRTAAPACGLFLVRVRY
ncbi:MAG: tRNA pseudouridine(38-40) synthase TruA [Chthoniobacterales bacterium]